MTGESAVDHLPESGVKDDRKCYEDEQETNGAYCTVGIPGFCIYA